MNFDGIISLLVASIEVLILFNLLIFVDKNKVNLLIISLIALLASYQIFEFLICNLEFKQPIYIYLAFSIITLIPVLNFIFINRVLQLSSSKKIISLEVLFLFSSIFFIIFYGLNLNLFRVEKCTVFYATYNYPLGFLYGVFYYTPIFISFLLLLYRFKNLFDKKLRNQIRILLLGFIFILTPPLIGFALRAFGMSELSRSMESVLCKFAFFYAIAISVFSLITSKFKDERNYLKYLSGYK